jgi:Ca2+-binding EF-hand superfamily protein
MTETNFPYYLARLFQLVSTNENLIEGVRLRLAQNALFNPFAAFRRMDVQALGYLTSEDVAAFMAKFNNRVGQAEAEFLFQNNQNKMPYNDFLNLVMTKSNPSLKNKLLEGSKQFAQQKSFTELDNYTIDQVIAEVLQKEIEYQIDFERLRASFHAPGVDFNNLYCRIDTARTGFIDYPSLDAFMREFKLEYTREDFAGLLRRVDKSNNHKINFLDFKNGLFPPFHNKPIQGEFTSLYKSVASTNLPSQQQQYLQSASNQQYQQTPSSQYVQQTPSSQYVQSPHFTSQNFFAGTGSTQQFQQPLNTPTANGQSVGQMTFSPPKPSTNLLQNYYRTDIPYADQLESAKYVNDPNNNNNGQNQTALWNQMEQNKNLDMPRVLNDYNISKEQYFSNANVINTGNLPHSTLSQELPPFSQTPSEPQFINTIPYRAIYEEKSTAGKEAMTSGTRSRSTARVEGVNPNYYLPENGGGYNSSFRRDRPMSSAGRLAGTSMRQQAYEGPVSPLKDRQYDPLYAQYWNLKDPNDQTVVNSNNYFTKPPSDFSKYNPKLYSYFVPYYNPPQVDEKNNFQRYPENPFRFTDHNHYFKNYYSHLKNQYYDYYYSGKLGEKGAFIDEPVRISTNGGDPAPVGNESEMDPMKTYPKYIPYRALQQSNYGNLVGNTMNQSAGFLNRSRAGGYAERSRQEALAAAGLSSNVGGKLDEFRASVESWKMKSTMKPGTPSGRAGRKVFNVDYMYSVDDLKSANDKVGNAPLVSGERYKKPLYGENPSGNVVIEDSEDQRDYNFVNEKYQNMWMKSGTSSLRNSKKSEY